MEDKLEALKRLDNGETLLKVSQDYNVGKTIEGHWKQNHSEIEKWCSQRVTETALEIRKTMKKLVKHCTCGLPNIETKVYLYQGQFCSKKR